MAPAKIHFVANYHFKTRDIVLGEMNDEMTSLFMFGLYGQNGAELMDPR